MEEVARIRFTNRKLRSLGNDVVKTAEAINLVYVSDTHPGILRTRNGKGFIYKYKGKTVTDIEVLGRIRSLVLPPAWRNVWICADPNGHLQATGLDARERKQYKYHPLWNNFRNQTKYFHLYDFGLALPNIREQIEKHLSLPGLPQEKVLAAVVSLMQCTSIRIGSNVYEKLNGSFGLTTMKDQHVRIDGHHMKFSFKGKKGIYHDISLKSRKLAKIVQACKDIPGKELFQYYDESGEKRSIDSGMVNNYIKSISSGNFTAKDFRTWTGSIHALQAFRQIGDCETVTEVKKRTVEVLDLVAKQLGNTRTVCKKYYVHPALFDLFEQRSLDKYFAAIEKVDNGAVDSCLTYEEKVLMKILEAHGHTVTIGG